MNRPTLTLFVLIIFCVACKKDDPEPAVTYPATGQYGDNILYQEKLEYTKSVNSFNAILPAGKSVAIRITAQPASSGIWTYEPGTISNWAIGSLRGNPDSQTFTSIDSGQPCELKLQFTKKGSFVIDYYEHDLSTPNFTKTITVNY